MSDMDLDNNLQIITATYAASYLEEAICGIDKYIDILPTDDYKAQVIATKRLYGEYLKKLKSGLIVRGNRRLKMNNDIRKLVDDNWEDIKELIIKKAEAEQKPKSIWDLETKDSEEYYYICSNGDIVWADFNSCFDEKVREVGNAFLTREEAEFELERRKIEAIMRKYSRPFKSGEFNCTVACETPINKMYIRTVQFHNSGAPFFASNEVAQKVIDEIGEDSLIKYWFGVTE